MKQSLYLLASCVWLLMSFYPATGNATGQQEAIGTVVAVRGHVLAVAASGSQRHLTLKDPIYREDTVRTGSGRIQLMFADNTLISLGRDSEMSIAEYDWQPDGKSGAMKTRIKEGTFRVMGGAITKVAPGNFSTETPAATIGIRGSMYAGKANTESLMVVFQGGKGIDVTNAAGSVAITKPGYGTMVFAPTRPPMPPLRFTAENLQTINEGLETTAGSDNSAPQERDENVDQSDSGASENQESNSALENGDDAGNVESQEIPQAEEEAEPAVAQDVGQLPENDPEGEELSSLSDLQLLDTPIVTDPEPSATPLTFEPPVDIVDVLVVANQTDTSTVTSTVITDNLPTTGIYEYKGSVDHASSRDSGTDQVRMEINWQSRALLGRIWDPLDETEEDGSIFFFGHYNSAAPILSPIQVIGRNKRDEQNPEITFGNGTSALFSGSPADNFSFSAAGGDYQVSGSQLLLDSWQANGTTVMTAQETAPAPPVKYEGFVMGRADNMSNPTGDYRLFMNSDPSGFYLDIDAAGGTFSGKLTASTATNSTSINVAAGGGYGSAYVLDDQFMGLMGCSGSCVQEGTSATGLKAYGNFLVTAHPNQQYEIESGVAGRDTEYLTWGYWEAAYQINGTDYHVFSDQGYWIAGVRTPQTFLDSLRLNSQAGFYQGGAKGIMVDADGIVTNVLGSTDIEVNFSSLTVIGSISFPGYTLSIDGALQTSGTFSSTSQGVVQGAVYGPNAEAIGGNFRADNYQGIFGGMRGSFYPASPAYTTPGI